MNSNIAGSRPLEAGAHTTAEEITAGIDLRGKIALVTGCSAGIGYETLRVLILRGAEVYALARNLEKAQQACAAVTGPGIKGTATAFACEHTDFSSVATCAEAVQARGMPIDMLICNAGLYGVATLEQVHGIEKQFVVNHLAHFDLVNRLLDLVGAARQGRIVVVGSTRDHVAPEAGIEFDNLSGERNYNASTMYGQSKLANALFVWQLAKQLSGTRATANILNPGSVKTEHALAHFRTHYNVDLNSQPEKKSVAQGAATTCYAATHPALDEVSGAFFEDCTLVTAGKHMQDDALAERLWRVSEELTRGLLRKSSGAK